MFSHDRLRACVTGQRPEAYNLIDYYVCPPTLAWTMVFTHEDGWLGPYFAVPPDYEALNKKNRKQVDDNERKRQEMARARSKGWRSGSRLTSESVVAGARIIQYNRLVTSSELPKRDIFSNSLSRICNSALGERSIWARLTGRANCCFC